jgi:glyoxylase-like metal-dependent hydrolase (beta-lactamase superfamily II)
MFKKPVLIAPEELKDMLDGEEVQFVFDLRSEDEFEGWRIEGRTPVETLNVPLEDFERAEESHLARLPKDKEIITVCTSGDFSKHVAQLLREKGFNARALEGGMDRWSEYYETRKINTDPDIYQIYRVAKGCISHVIISGNKAVVIDATRHIEHIEKVLSDTGAKLVHVFETHLQLEHISGGRELAQKHNAHYHINSSEAIDAHFHFTPLLNGEEIRIGFGSLLTAYHTPGHTVGSSSLVLDGKFIFTGNTIMPSSVGRPAFRGMARLWADLLYSSLHERFDDLPDEMVVLPSHAEGIHEQGADGSVRFTMGEARKRLPLMSITDREQFIEYVEATMPDNPECYQLIRKVNMGIIDPDEERRRELETGKNLCGIADARKERSPAADTRVMPSSKSSGSGTDELPSKSSLAVSVMEDEEPSESEDVPADEAGEEIDVDTYGNEEVARDVSTDSPIVGEPAEELDGDAEKTVTEPTEAGVGRLVESDEEVEVVVVVETDIPEPISEQPAPEVAPQPSPKTAAISDQPGTTAMTASEEMSEIFGKLATERFDEIAASFDLNAMLLEALTPALKDALTRILWESTPQITEKLLKQVVENSFGTLNEKLGGVIRGTVPELAETIIRKEMKKLHTKG